MATLTIFKNKKYLWNNSLLQIFQDFMTLLKQKLHDSITSKLYASRAITYIKLVTCSHLHLFY